MLSFQLPPRNIHDRLVNARLIHCAYMQAGIICTTGAYFTYCVCFAQNGFRPSMLFGLRAAWENPNLDDLQDSYGQEWVSLLMRSNIQEAFYEGRLLPISELCATDEAATSDQHGLLHLGCGVSVGRCGYAQSTFNRENRLNIFNIFNTETIFNRCGGRVFLTKE